MLCPQGHPLPVPDFTAQFCPTCGAALINPCPVGHDNVPNARFCRDCGRSMGLASGTPTLATVSVVPPTTAVVRPVTVAALAGAARSVGGRPVATAPGPPTTDEAGSGSGSGSATGSADDERVGRGWLVAIAVIAAAVVGVVIALVATSSGDSSPSASTSAREPATRPPSTTVPASTSTSTSTTLSPQAAPQGQALTALLSQNSSTRSQVGTATAAITACGDLPGAQATLTAAQTSRQTLLGQLGQLNLSALPQSASLINALTTAWQSSASSDGSYAQWAADEQAKPCVPNDTTDAGYQSALVSDGHASTAKQQFTSLWNPIATSLGLQQWQPNQL
jgi:hypothetical protein